MRKILFPLLLIAFFPLESRLYFIHIPKTAGTTLRNILEMQVGADEVYPYRYPRVAKDLVAHDLVSGHLPYWLCMRLDRDFDKAYKMTVLREPIDRYLSFLRAKKKCDNHPNLESVMDKQFVPKHVYRFGLIDNAMCRFLSDRPHLEGEELLSSAKEGLEKMDCVLFFDTFVTDAVDLFVRLGVVLDKKDIPKMNASQEEPVSKVLLDRIRQVNLWDLRLYEYAKTRLGKKNIQYRLRGAAFEEILRSKSAINYTFDLPINGKGWGYRQKENASYYRLVLNEPAYIYFPLAEERNYQFSFTARPYISSSAIKVYVNGHEVELTEKQNALFVIYSGMIQKEWLNERPTEIAFHPQDSGFYYDSKRNCLLASFAIHSIQVN